MAPSTPPPPSRVVFAAFTIASTFCMVMSPSTTAILALSNRDLSKQHPRSPAAAPAPGAGSGAQGASPRTKKLHGPLSFAERDLDQAVGENCKRDEREPASPVGEEGQLVAPQKELGE